MDAPLGTVGGRRTPPTRRPPRSVGRSRRLVAALSLCGAVACALVPMTVPLEVVSAQSGPAAPTIVPLPGSTYQPLPPTPTPTPRVLPPTPAPTSTQAPIVPPPPGVRVTPPGAPGVPVPPRAPAQVPAQGAAPGLAQVPARPSGPAQVPAAASGPAQVPQRPPETSGKPAEIPAVGTAAPSAVPPLVAGLGLLLVAAGAAIRRR